MPEHDEINKDTNLIQALSDGARIIDEANQGRSLTKAGRALQKHGNRPDSAFPKPTGSPSDLNRAGQEIVDDILTTPGTEIENVYSSRFGPVIEARAPDGRGLRYDSNGTLIGFLEP
ncbi:hypothetical protein HYR99_13860 [Candidatus Poribacteria bacterium]|nr:hypothetical protein [Candidatus Poribacteria bacterium]